MDSIITGGLAFPHTPKIMTFARRQHTVLCWEGDLPFTQTFTSSAINDVDSSDTLISSRIPLVAVAKRLAKVFTKLWYGSLNDQDSQYRDAEFSFIVAGYCPVLTEIDFYHLKQDWNQWKIIEHRRTIRSTSVYLFGSGRTKAREILSLNPNYSPYQVLKSMIEDPEVTDVGGVPQLVTVDHQGAKALGIIKNGERYLYGHPLHSGGHRNLHCVQYEDNEF